MSTSRPSPTLLNLPPELLQHLLSFLPLSSLLSLASVNHSLHTIITYTSLPSYLRSISYPSTLTPAHSHARWSIATKARWSDDTSDNFHRCDSVAEALGGVDRVWPRKCMPVLRLWDRAQVLARGRVLIGRGEELEMWEVDDRGRSELVPMLPFLTGGGGTSGSEAVGGQADLTGIVVVSSDSLVLSRVSGLVQRVRVEEPYWDGSRWYPGRLVETARYSLGAGSTPWMVQSLHSAGNLLASASTARPRPIFRTASSRAPLSTTQPTIDATSLADLRPSTQAHQISLSSLSSPWSPPITLSVPNKPWSVLLGGGTIHPSWLAIGHSGHSPLSLHQLDSTGSPTSSTTSLLTTEGKPTAVYSLATPSPHSTTLHPTQTLLAAVYDSTTRVYDLRFSSRGGEVMRLRDPWSDDPSYSIASGGPQGSWIVTGAARNGAVRVWDVRMARGGGSLSVSGGGGGEEAAGAGAGAGGGGRGGGGATFFSPHADRSPIYSLAVEFSRIWGVTDRRGFSFDFDSVAAAGRPMVGRRGEAEGAKYILQEGGEGRGVLRCGWDGRVETPRERERERARGEVVNRGRGRAAAVKRW